MSSIKIKPLGKRLLVKRKVAEAVVGGIFLPESSKEKPKEGEIIGIGLGSYNDQGQLQPVDLNVGDVVLFGGYAGTEVKIDEDGDYLILNEDEVLAVVQ